MVTVMANYGLHALKLHETQIMKGLAHVCDVLNGIHDEGLKKGMHFLTESC